MAVILGHTLLPGPHRLRSKTHTGLRSKAQGFLHLSSCELHDLMHLPFFGMLAFLWASMFVRRAAGRDAALRAFVITAAFGLLDELLQSQVPGRDASLRDATLDCLGAIAGAFLGVKC
ncbi:MAG: VanZ family protein [Deltaproteobacteria bacterium]